jgi:rhodanese-related sulfurtransferase
MWIKTSRLYLLHGGGRSAAAANWMRQNGFKNVLN